MRVHLLGIPHTITRDDFSHCAFTGKVQRMGPMLTAQGIEVIHYGVEGSVSGATEDANLMTEAEHLELLGHPYHEQPKSGFYGDDAVEGTPLYRQWNYNARQELMARLEPGDLILLPFGRAHEAAIRDLPILRRREVAAVESGIGYAECFMPYRVYESEAWRHTITAREGRGGVVHESGRLDWVIPNYYSVSDWPFHAGGQDVVFLGRIGKPKGVDLIPRLAAERPDINFKICGQGDPAPYIGLPNVEFVPPMFGKARAAYLGSARAIICPSTFTEPFCGVTIEAALCGTPAITSSYGAFTETVKQGVTGIRCQTQNQWLDALDKVVDISRHGVASRARAKYSLEAVGPQYKSAFSDVISNCLL